MIPVDYYHVAEIRHPEAIASRRQSRCREHLSTPLRQRQASRQLPFATLARGWPKMRRRCSAGLIGHGSTKPAPTAAMAGFSRVLLTCGCRA